MTMNVETIAVNAAKILEASGCIYEIKTPEGKVLKSGYKKEKLQWEPELFSSITPDFSVGNEITFDASDFNPREIQSFWSVAVTKAKKAWGDKNYQTSFDKGSKTITLSRIVAPATPVAQSEAA